MLISSDIFLGLISSMFASGLYGLIRRVLYLTCIAPYFKFTVPLVKDRVITNGLVHGVSYLYLVCLLKNYFISNLIVVVNQVSIFCGYYLYSFTPYFSDMLIPNPPYFLSVESYHVQISIGSYYNLSAYWLLR